MPTIYEYFGIVFKFFSDEHEPIHVHVQHNGGEAVFELILENGQLSEIRQRKQKGPLFRKKIRERPGSSSKSMPTTLLKNG